MRISETGNKVRRVYMSSGYTLLEIMAVITLIGIISLLVYPQFTISPEKSEIIYIGKLVKSDLNLVKEESYSSKKEISLWFIKNGYVYAVDEAEIWRRFNRYQFTFDIPVPEENELEENEPETGDENPDEEESFSDLVTGQNADADSQAEDSLNNDVEPHQLRFTSKGKCNMYELSWHTIHFTGKIKVDQDGVLDWSYARK